MPHNTLADAANAGFHDASLYDAYRPSYPAAAVDGLLAKLEVTGKAEEGGSRSLQIVEIAAGTGKFTEELSRRAAASRAPWSIVAVEPHDQMRAQLAAKNLPHVRVVAGHAGAVTAVEDGWADAVVIAQAFHWFDNLDALRDIRRLLKPGALVGVIWNIEDYNKPADWPATTRWEQLLNDAVLALPPDGHTRFRENRWPAAFAAASQAEPPLFGALADARTSWSVAVTTEALWKRLLTLSQVANLPEDQEKSGDGDGGVITSRREVRRRLEAALAEPDVERSGDGAVTLHAKTYYAWARRA